MTDYVDGFIESMTTERTEHRILDVGIGSGEKSIALAEIGHTVVGITNCEEEYDKAKKMVQRKGLGNCTFLMMSVEDIKSEFGINFFDDVIASRVFHFLPREATLPTIDTLKSLTAPGGQHIIQGYLVNPALSRSKINREKMFKPGELREIYAGDTRWTVEGYSEDPFSCQLVGDKEWVSSLVKMTARKSKTPRSR